MLRVSGALRVPRGNGIGDDDGGTTKASSRCVLSSVFLLPLGSSVFFSSPSFPIMSRHRRRHPFPRSKRRRCHRRRQSHFFLSTTHETKEHATTHKKKKTNALSFSLSAGSGALLVVGRTKGKKRVLLKSGEKKNNVALFEEELIYRSSLGHVHPLRL